ncbi:TetR/AcrR family transcriptional regulator [Verrucomicrobium sp. 3C]|uniref:TetR/AcrR family transcriptional regulator n=1 Tax=Verrucomicrobium sp. 3C TaxID=1134055 RepID=UPI00036CE26B|nr:TetR/AcrR family transcriptional regulator [Verrucomicrobium sp. 3C]
MRTLNERSDVVPRIAEVFRELGYEGTSLSQIIERTGVGKGSLYHFFPGGKEEMAGAVLADVDAWFERHVFQPLQDEDSDRAIATMWDAVNSYFCSGGRICLVGAFALDETRNRFADVIAGYFRRWIQALTGALVRQGWDKAAAAATAEEIVLGIQGALILARALGDQAVFSRSMQRLQVRTRRSSHRR